MSLSSKLHKAGAKAPKNRATALWQGPESDDDNGGISYSLLSRWLCCRERFRLLVVEGLRPSPQFYPPLDYGNMWHLCEEAYGNGVSWENELKEYCKELCRKYPTQQQQIAHWYEICKAQFPIYLDYWSKHPDEVAKTPLLREKAFKVPYKLPSGRVVYLRGKWDGVDLIGE